MLSVINLRVAQGSTLTHLSVYFELNCCHGADVCLQRLREIIADTVKSMNLCALSPFEHFSSSKSLS